MSVVNQYKVSIRDIHLFSLAGPTGQCLNGTHKFSELVLTRIALSRSVLPLRSAKARESGQYSSTQLPPPPPSCTPPILLTSGQAVNFDRILGNPDKNVAVDE